MAACRFRTLQDGVRQFYAGKIPGRPFCRRNDECRFERVEFSLCDLTMAEFSRTRLKGLSFVDSDIRGIRVGDTGSFELKGLKVSALQASELARLLGLEIEG